MQNDECRMKLRLRFRRLLFCILRSAFCIGFIALPGCQNGGGGASTQPTTRPASAYDRQEAAMKDPFGYSPNPGKTDISGGGLSEFDKDGFRKDMKNVFDP